MMYLLNKPSVSLQNRCLFHDKVLLDLDQRNVEKADDRLAGSKQSPRSGTHPPQARSGVIITCTLEITEAPRRGTTSAREAGCRRQKYVPTLPSTMSPTIMSVSATTACWTRRFVSLQHQHQARQLQSFTFVTPGGQQATSILSHSISDLQNVDRKCTHGRE